MLPRDPIVGQDAHADERRARVAQRQIEPHTGIPEWCAHGIGYDERCNACEDEEDALVEEFRRERDGDDYPDRADVEEEDHPA